MSIEIINQINANRSHANDSDYLSNNKSNLTLEHRKLELEADKLKKQVRDLEDALLTAKAENEGMKNDMFKYSIDAERQALELKKKEAADKARKN